MPDVREALMDVIEGSLPPYFTDMQTMDGIADAILTSGLVVPAGDPHAADKEAASWQMIQPLCAYINETPALLSLLYDINMLPEQIVTPGTALRLRVICDLWRERDAAYAAIQSFVELWDAFEDENGEKINNAIDALRALVQPASVKEGE